ESVVVRKRLERPGSHLIAKIRRPLKRGDLGCQPLANAEMACLPSHRLAEFDQTAGSPRNGFLAGVVEGTRMEIDVAGKIETAFDRGGNGCFNPKCRHSAAPQGHDLSCTNRALRL